MGVLILSQGLSFYTGFTTPPFHSFFYQNAEGIPLGRCKLGRDAGKSKDVISSKFYETKSFFMD